MLAALDIDNRSHNTLFRGLWCLGRVWLHRPGRRSHQPISDIAISHKTRRDDVKIPKEMAQLVQATAKNYGLMAQVRSPTGATHTASAVNPHSSRTWVRANPIVRSAAHPTGQKIAFALD
jgi:hypothetical protein